MAEFFFVDVLRSTFRVDGSGPGAGLELTNPCGLSLRVSPPQGV